MPTDTWQYLFYIFARHSLGGSNWMAHQNNTRIWGQCGHQSEMVAVYIIRWRNWKSPDASWRIIPQLYLFNDSGQNKSPFHGWNPFISRWHLGLLASFYRWDPRWEHPPYFHSGWLAGDFNDPYAPHLLPLLTPRLIMYRSIYTIYGTWNIYGTYMEHNIIQYNPFTSLKLYVWLYLDYWLSPAILPFFQSLDFQLGWFSCRGTPASQDLCTSTRQRLLGVALVPGCSAGLIILMIKPEEPTIA